MKNATHKDISAICIVIFKEHPVVNFAHEEPGVFDISARGAGIPSDFVINSRFSVLDYCRRLILKITELQQIEMMSFLEYQCRQIKDPIGWLNHLEKLLQVNTTYFIAEGYLDKISCALIYIEEIKNRFKQLKSHHGPFEHGIYYKNPFHDIKDELSTLNTYEDKITLLIKRKTEYLQNEPPFIIKHHKPLDKLIDLEIEKLQQLRNLQAESLDKSSGYTIQTKKDKKIQFNAQLNVLVDIFYQMKNNFTANGIPYLNASIQEITEIITANFLDKDGNEISPSTVRTILSPNRPEKRPKLDKRLSIKI